MLTEAGEILLGGSGGGGPAGPAETTGTTGTGAGLAEIVEAWVEPSISPLAPWLPPPRAVVGAALAFTTARPGPWAGTGDLQVACLPWEAERLLLNCPSWEDCPGRS